MKTSNTKRKIAETLVGAAVGAVIAGPAGAVAGGLAGSQVAGHNPTPEEGKPAEKEQEHAEDDPVVHASLKRIVVPVDFSPSSFGALRFAREWAVRFGSEICLLHVLEPATNFGLLGSEAIVPAPPPPDCGELIRAELERIAHKQFPDSTKVSVAVRYGIPYDEIVTAAQEMAADLIVISTHGRSGLSRAMMGSTAERIVRHATCPVLTVRRAR